MSNSKPRQPNYQDLIRLCHEGAPPDSWAHAWRKDRRESVWFPAGHPPKLADQWLHSADIYFSVNPVTGSNPRCISRCTRNEFIASIAVIYADFDTNTLPPLALEPSVIVRSGGGLHCYWALDRPVQLDAGARSIMAGLQRAWVHHIGADHAAVDLKRLLRLPGSFNYKQQPLRPVTILTWEPGRRYSLPDFVSQVDANMLTTAPAAVWEKSLTPSNQVTGVGRAFSRTGAAVDDLRRAAMGRARWRDGGSQLDAFDRLWAGDIAGYPSHSEADAALCRLAAFWYGRDAGTVASMFVQSGLFRPDRCSEDYIRRTAEYAVRVSGEWRPPAVRDMAAVDAARELAQ